MVDILKVIYGGIQWVFSGIGITILQKTTSNGSKKIVVKKSSKVTISGNKDQNIQIKESNDINIKDNE